jgi:hypothetical protein
MSYVGADAQQLDALRGVVGVAAGELARSRGRIAGLFAEAGEVDVVGPTLAAVESELGAAGCEIGAAAAIAAADASAGGQAGWRASLGMVDDVAADLFFVNDLYRVFGGRDINTGQQVGTGERVASGIFLIPFAKLAKAGKLLKFGDNAADVAAGAAARTTGRAAVINADEISEVLTALRRGRSRNKRIRVVDTEADLDALFEGFTSQAAPLPTRPFPTRMLPDGTTVARRPDSSSGGPTLVIREPSDVEWKVHIDPWPPR